MQTILKSDIELVLLLVLWKILNDLSNYHDCFLKCWPVHFTVFLDMDGIINTLIVS